MKPPYRADQVGSLLRPRELAEARAKFRKNELPAPELKAVEDRCIREAVARQEAIGLESITDGEMRRDWWHMDFMTQLDGVTAIVNPGPIFVGTEEQPPIPSVTGKIGCSKPIMVQDFVFLNNNTTKTAKFTIPSPAMLRLRGGRSSISTQVYPEMGAFWADTAAAYRKAIKHLSDAGCRYLQLDDVSFSYLCDPKIQDTCRGNFKSSWVASGGYEPVAEAMFSCGVDAFFMEFDSDRAGGFEPLRHLPRDKKVVLGLVTSKTPVLESKDYLKKRIEEAARFVPLENLCLSPQCGFSSTHHGNSLTQDEQWRKLQLVVEVAREVWG